MAVLLILNELGVRYRKCDKTPKHCASSNARKIVYLTRNPLFWCSPFLTVSAVTVRSPRTVPQCIWPRVKPRVRCLATVQFFKWSLCCFTSVNNMTLVGWNIFIKVLQQIRKKRVRWSRYRPGVAQRVGRVIPLFFHGRGIRRGWVVSSTPRPHFAPGKEPVPILQEAGWAPGPVWTGGKSRPHRDSIPDRPARSQSLYRLSYAAHTTNTYFIFLSSWFRASYFNVNKNPTVATVCRYLFTAKLL